MSETPFAYADRAAERWAERARAQGDELARAAIREAAWARRLTLTDERDYAYRDVLASYRAAADRHLELLTKRPLLTRR